MVMAFVYICHRGFGSASIAAAPHGGANEKNVCRPSPNPV
jgi:hypothetical protein